MRKCKQSTTRTVMIFMTDSTDHVAGKTGLTLTITASKAGGAFAAITPDVTERGSGWYAVDLTAAMLDTLGDYALHAEASGSDPGDVLLEVVAYDPADAAGLGLTRLDAAMSTRALEDGGGIDAIGTMIGVAGAGLTALASASDLSAIDTVVDAIKAKTDNLPANPAALGGEMTLTSGAVDEILDEAVEGSITLRQAIRVLLAVLAGKSTVATGTIAYRDQADAKNRVLGTVDAEGARTSVTLDVS